jgi:predicted esterase
LRNWSRKSALVCGTISLLAVSSARAQGDLPEPAAAAPPKTPAIALLDAADAPQWQAWVGGLGWKVIAPPAATAQATGIDARVQALDAAVGGAIRDAGVDPGRVYLAGRGASTASVFYAISRIPDRWAAAVALGGSPEAAVTTGRVFAANFTNVPVLWIGPGADEPELAGKLKKAGVNLEWRSSAGISNAAVFEWLARHRRDEFPDSIDCEVNSLAFARCYWIQVTKVDPGERNDILPTTRVAPGSGASLDLGNFGFKPDDPGPGLLVSFLGEKYSGPLKLGDRIVELDGKPIENPRQYAETMNRTVENRRVTVMVERGQERIRVETTIVVPRRDPAVTARVQARFDAAGRVIEIVSRVVAEMRVTIPPHWVPGGLNWNGLSIEAIDKPGCILLTIEKELLHSSACSAN